MGSHPSTAFLSLDGCEDITTLSCRCRCSFLLHGDVVGMWLSFLFKVAFACGLPQFFCSFMALCCNFFIFLLYLCLGLFYMMKGNDGM